MTPEERFRKIEDTLVVQGELVAWFERDTERRQRSLEDRADGHAQELAEFRATVARVLPLLGKFVAEQSGGDGRH